ncbi:MAG: GDSL-type esterase/lipase family protein [Leeuwenhoekiella sp.]
MPKKNPSPFQQSLTQNMLQDRFPSGSIITQTHGVSISVTHKKVKYVHWLLHGRIDYHVKIHNPEQEILVAQTEKPLTPVGWNGLLPPGRFTYTCKVSSENATFFKVELKEFRKYVEHDVSNELLYATCVGNYQLLKNALNKHVELLQPHRFRVPDEKDEFFMGPEMEKSEIVSLMRRSPFLDQFSEGNLSNLAALTERRDYEPDETLYVQDEFTQGLFILIHGEVAIKRLEGKVDVSQRSISSSGFIFGWSSLIGQRDICNAVTTAKSAVYFIGYQDILQLLENDVRFARKFYLRLLWLIGNQVNAAFVRYTSLLGKHSIQAVYQLIENNRSRLSVGSQLHAVYHLLKDFTTKNLAYAKLNELVTAGTALERHIASLSLEFLKNDQREHRFMNGLREIYESVAENVSDASPEALRKACAEATKKAIKPVLVHIEGRENLPKESGNIFIYNHLVNHPFYTLSNNFQITLDSHFISALLLDEKYGEPGIRTVRVGQGQEFGHQNYYDNLGYINVFTKESESDATENTADNRSIFYKSATAFLEDGKNLIISPEGTSYTTEESPGPFKTGAFTLAINQKDEPYIVPIVLVNFDKRINDTLFYCRVLEPFKVSERLKDQSPQALKNFVIEYQKEYVDYVSQARERVNALMTTNFSALPDEAPPPMWENEIKRLRRRVVKLENSEGLHVFYGSSSVRLWVRMQENLAPLNTLNLGFGGSTYAWCLHYFQEVFENVHPSKLILYAGENDIAQGRSPLEVLADFKELINAVKTKYPKVPLAVISLKPSLERAHMIPQFMEMNELLSEYAIKKLDAQFINVFSQMISLDDKPNPDFYMSDGLHMNKKGYAIWSRVIRKALME